MNASDLDSAMPELERYIRETLHSQRVVGAAIGIVNDQELAWFGAYGYADVVEERRPDERTLFRIDSNTKPFTGTAIMQLRDQGKLDINDPLVEYVPEFERADIRHGSVADVTLLRLLTHRAGLSGEAPGLWWETGIGPSTAELLESLDQVGVVIPPDSQHKYCNLGFILLGLVVERLSGQDYGEYIRENILEPLAMDSTTFDPDSSPLPRVVQYNGPEFQEQPSPALKLVHNVRRPAGGIYSTIPDMARWISLQFRTEASERGGAQVLAGTTIEEMHWPRYAEPDWEAGQCAPWRAVRSGDRMYLGHGGGNAGSLSQTYFNKQRRVGIVVLTNSDAHQAHLDIAMEVMDRLADVADARREAPVGGPPRPCPDGLARLLGLYSTGRPNTRMRVAWVDGSLVLLDGGESLPRELDPAGGRPTPARLDPTDADGVFIAREARLAGETITFRIGDDGQASGFELQTGSRYYRMGPAG